MTKPARPCAWCGQPIIGPRHRARYWIPRMPPAHGQDQAVKHAMPPLRKRDRGEGSAPGRKKRG